MIFHCLLSFPSIILVVTTTHRLVNRRSGVSRYASRSMARITPTHITVHVPRLEAISMILKEDSRASAFPITFPGIQHLAKCPPPPEEHKSSYQLRAATAHEVLISALETAKWVLIEIWVQYPLSAASSSNSNSAIGLVFHDDKLSVHWYKWWRLSEARIFLDMCQFLPQIGKIDVNWLVVPFAAYELLICLKGIKSFFNC